MLRLIGYAILVVGHYQVFKGNQKWVDDRNLR